MEDLNSIPEHLKIVKIKDWLLENCKKSKEYGIYGDKISALL